MSKMTIRKGPNGGFEVSIDGTPITEIASEMFRVTEEMVSGVPLKDAVGGPSFNITVGYVGGQIQSVFPPYHIHVVAADTAHVNYLFALKALKVIPPNEDFASLAQECHEILENLAIESGNQFSVHKITGLADYPVIPMTAEFHGNTFGDVIEQANALGEKIMNDLADLDGEA